MVTGDANTELGEPEATASGIPSSGEPFGGEVGASGQGGMARTDDVETNPGRSVEVGAEAVVDLRFGELTVDLRRESEAIPIGPVVRPFVEGTSVLERHVGGTRLAEVVTRRDEGTSGSPGWPYHAAKRALDLVTALVLVLVLLPVWVAAAVAIVVSSRGPVFYRQTRYGIGNKEFRMLKFRTMVAGADSMLEEMEDLVARGEVDALNEVVFKAHNDPRITRVGRVLRRTNLDETPQLLNVITGSMTLVGPRPLVTAEVEVLSDQLLDIRHSVRPGITCLWQVLRREDTTFAERMALDIVYVQRPSLLLDGYLLALTPRSILHGVRSY